MTVSPDTLRVRAVALDLDGTLLDTVHDLAAAVNALLVGWGERPLAMERVRAMIGKGMANLVRRALAESRGVSAEAIEDAEAAEALAGYQARTPQPIGEFARTFMKDPDHIALFMEGVARAESRPPDQSSDADSRQG